MTGGASAAYGSDALSGVVNFILDRDFTGIKGEVQAGMTKYRDDKNYSGQLTYGTPFANGRGHFLLSGEHTHNDGIKGTKGRPWAELPAAIIINPLYGTGAGQSTGNPQNVVRRDVGLSAGTPGGIITSGVLKGTYFGPGGVVTGGYNFGVNVGNDLQEGGDWRYSRIENGIDIAGMINRYVGYTRVSYDLTDNVTAYADAQWSIRGEYGDWYEENVQTTELRLHRVVNDELMVSYASLTPLTLYVRSATGQLVRTVQWPASPTPSTRGVDAAGLASGVYILQVQGADGTVQASQVL